MSAAGLAGIGIILGIALLVWSVWTLAEVAVQVAIKAARAIQRRQQARRRARGTA